MTAPIPSQAGFLACFHARAALFFLALGLALGVSVPALADNLSDTQLLIKRGQFPQALEKIDTYLADKPKDAQGRFLKGLILTEMGKSADAIAVLTKLTEDYPELPEPYNNLAVIYAQQKQYDKARTALEMAIRTHPAYATAYENLGDVYARMASQAYDKALQLDSANAAAQNKMALIRDLISAPVKSGARPKASTTPAIVATTAASTSGATAVTPPSPSAPPTASVVASTPGAAAASVPATEANPAKTKSAEPGPAEPQSPALKSDPAADEVLEALNAWAAAWAHKNVKAYLAHYASGFQPPKGMSRKEWEAERYNRIASKPGKIEINLDKPQIALNGDKATAKFRQHYKAPGLKSMTNKTLILVRSGNKWLILEENAF